MLTNMKAFMILFSMILFFFSSKVIVEAQPKVFSYMTFAQTWPPAFCNYIAKCSSPMIHDNFTIHGLWDSYTPSILSPGPCSKTPLDPKLVAPIKSEMDKSWPNLKNQNDNTRLWGHEWTKHGTCLASVLDQTAYFMRSLYWKNEFDILTIMKKSGLNPGGSYQENAIKTAIETQVKSDIVLICTNPKQQYLVEVRICVDRSGTQVTSCAAMGLTGDKNKCDANSLITIAA